MANPRFGGLSGLKSINTVAQWGMLIGLAIGVAIFANAYVTRAVRSVTGADGVLAVTSGGIVTVTEVLTTQTALADSSALGPLVGYRVLIGGFQPIAQNTWRTAPIAGFPIVFFPGSLADSGQGDVGSTGWAVVVPGTYTLHADCEVTPSAIDHDDMQSATVALSLGATSEDPLAAGFIPFGAYATIDLSTGINGTTAPALARRISLAATFQAGCVGCPVLLGDSLTVHARLDHTGAQPSVTAMVLCRVQVSRVQ